MAEHLSVTEIDKEAKKLKRDLEGWREIILPLNSILLWEKNSYLGIILGVTTVGFLFLWHMDPSFLTTISFIGLLMTTVDYFVPILTMHLFPPDNWTSAKERKLESICRTLAAKKIFIFNTIKSFYEMRHNRPKMYYIVVITTLLFLSWIGNAINNLFLTYLLVNALLLIPGIQHRGLMDKYTSTGYKYLLNTFGSVVHKKEE